MKHPPPRICTLVSDQSGIVFVEFLIAFVPLWVFFLCVIQVAFTAQADLVVKHSADSAARSAVVVLPDDPSEYGGEPQRSLHRNPVTASDIGRVLERVSSTLASSSSSQVMTTALSDQILLNLGKSRLNTIRLAAHVPVMSLAPVNVGHDSQPSIAKTVGAKRKLLTAFYYQPFALAVTFPGLRTNVANGPEITVRVTYAYQCTIPLARKLLCQSFRDLDFEEELGKAFFPLAQTIVGGRFRGIQREATLMIHDAPYEYRTQDA